ncbi:hypothetical protein [Nostoc punctiforme]|uniref:hypothetical protein n=1 Tax=Nostoc punctiforme TaxID=272131 RepID=UPI0011D1744B|nr:hypothetical protein [Nostoc punctiforme]
MVDDTAALLTYTDGDNITKSVKFVGAMPIDVEVNNINKEHFFSSGNAPLNHFAPGSITAVSCIGNFRQIASNPSTELPCTYILDNALITDNRITAEYDSLYSDNSGDMDFTVSYISTENIIRAFRNGEIIYKDVRKAPITFKVDCIKDSCPDGYLKCESDNYPGYCCISCSELKSTIANITASVRNK